MQITLNSFRNQNQYGDRGFNISDTQWIVLRFLYNESSLKLIDPTSDLTIITLRFVFIYFVWFSV